VAPREREARHSCRVLSERGGRHERQEERAKESEDDPFDGAQDRPAHAAEQYTARVLDRRKALKLHALLVILMLVTGSVVYARIENQPFINSAYTIVMITTLIGSNRDPETVAGKLFLMALALTSAGVFLSLVVQVFGPALAASLYKEWRMKKSVESDGHVILCGMTGTAKSLLARMKGHPDREVVVLVKDEKEGIEASEEGFTVIAGDFTTKKVLEQAGVERAAYLIAASDEDAENAFACLSAKLMNPKVRVLVRVSVEENREKLEEVGADVIISPAVLAAEAILAGLSESKATAPRPTRSGRLPAK
jgi:voltage-gated potassium channel